MPGCSKHIIAKGKNVLKECGMFIWKKKIKRFDKIFWKRKFCVLQNKDLTQNKWYGFMFSLIKRGKKINVMLTGFLLKLQCVEERSPIVIILKIWETYSWKYEQKTTTNFQLFECTNVKTSSLWKYCRRILHSISCFCFWILTYMNVGVDVMWV